MTDLHDETAFVAPENIKPEDIGRINWTILYEDKRGNEMVLPYRFLLCQSRREAHAAAEAFIAITMLVGLTRVRPFYLVGGERIVQFSGMMGGVLHAKLIAGPDFDEAMEKCAADFVDATAEFGEIAFKSHEYYGDAKPEGCHRCGVDPEQMRQQYCRVWAVKLELDEERHAEERRDESRRLATPGETTEERTG